MYGYLYKYLDVKHITVRYAFICFYQHMLYRRGRRRLHHILYGLYFCHFWPSTEPVPCITTQNLMQKISLKTNYSNLPTAQ
jgi:hypothetical protein